MKIIKPKKLKRGSSIAVISPSWGGSSKYPGIYKKGLNVLKEVFGFNIIEYPTATMKAEDVYNKPELRAKDVNAAFGNKEVDAVIATIGGDDSMRILQYLDIPKMLKNPKIIMGFSDTTTLLTYLNTKGLVTFHGPTIMAGWAQLESFDYLAGYYKKMLMQSNKEFEIRPFPTWSSGYPDWADAGTWGKVSNLQTNKEGFRWLQGEKKVSGRLWGGCIEVLDFIKGTEYWPEKSFWQDRILLLETSEEKPSGAYVGRSLRNLGVQGMLNRIAGILFGRLRDYTVKEKEELYDIIINIVAGEFGRTDLAIVANMDFGHTDPNLIMPLGINTEIDAENRRITFKESFFSD